MLSLGGFFLALFLGDVILGWGQSQPVGVTDCKDMSERSFRALSGTSHYPSCFWKHQKKDVETAARPWLYWWMKHRLKKKKKVFKRWLSLRGFFLFIVHIKFQYQHLVNKKEIKLLLNNFVKWRCIFLFYFAHTHTHTNQAYKSHTPHLMTTLRFSHVFTKRQRITQTVIKSCWKKRWNSN